MLFSGSSRMSALARNSILAAFVSKQPNALLTDLVVLTPSELKSMAKLGNGSLEWFEGYLSLLGVTLAGSRSVPGMSKASQDFLASL